MLLHNSLGIVKDILLVVLSVVVFGSPVTPLQYAGYGVALLGLNLHKEYKVSPKCTLLFCDLLYRLSWMKNRNLILSLVFFFLSTFTRKIRNVHLTSLVTYCPAVELGKIGEVH